MSARVGALMATAVAVGLAALAFFADPIATRVIAGIGAVAAAVACFVLWALAGPPNDEAGLLERLGVVALMALTGLFAFVATFVGSAVLVGAWQVNRTEPVDLGQVEFGVAVLILLVVALVAWLWDSLFDIVFRWSQRWLRLGASVFLAVLVVGGIVTKLSLGDVPREDPDIEIERQAKRAGLGQYDLLVVVDPADPASRNLIRAARRHRDAGEEMFPIERGAVSYDLAFGIAVPQPAVGRRPLWRLVEPPTLDGLELRDSLADLRPRRGSAAASSYGRLLVDVLETGEVKRVRWRDSAQRGVVFMLQNLPSLAELDAGVRVNEHVIPRRGAARAVCPRFLASRSPGQIPREPWVPVPWGDALREHCAQRQEYREWQAKGRDPKTVPDEPVAVHAVTGETRHRREVDWWTWVRALDGIYHRPPLVRGHSGILRADAEVLLRAAAKLHTGQPVGDLADAVKWFRPHLFFDSGEQLRPVDVDWFLSPQAGAERHEICDRTTGRDNCEEIEGPAGLVGQLDEYLDLRGTARFFDERPDKQRMYVHVRRSASRLFLGYWWFYPSNVSPWRPEVNCLPGFTFADTTCFDHEADWEGVTVELSLRRQTVLPDPYQLSNLTPEAVIYDFHGHSVRWPWERVDLLAEPGSYATHPAVYPAKGSHASYPAGCSRKRCDQRLGGESLGEGRFDGGAAWAYNDRDACYPPRLENSGTPPEPCVVALPSTRDGRLGVVWNAFPGRWGAATCAAIAKACTQTDGPASPARQERYLTPRDTRTGPIRALEDFWRDYADRKRDSPRWPPDPWPPRGAGPATPALG